MRAHGAWRREAGGRGPCAGDPQPPAREAPHELPRPRTEPRAEGLNDYQTRCADDGREGTGKAAEVELKDPGKGWERGRGGAVGPSLQGRGVRTGSPGPAPSSSAASSQLPHLRPVPGEPGFRSGVRSQAPAPANPPLPLGSRPVSAEGRSCRFRRGRAAPHTRMHWPPVRGALALSHSLQGRCGRQRVWWPPSRSTPLSQPTLLCEGPPRALGQEPAGWVSANGQGPGGQLPGDRSRGGLLSRERTPGETPPPFESCDCALGSGSQTRSCPGCGRSPLSMASRTSIPSVVIAVPRSKNTLKKATAKRLSPRGARPTRAGSQGLTRILSGLPGGPLSLPVTLLLPQRGMQRGTETCPRPHGTERGALAPPRPAPFLNGLPVRPPASRHRPVVQSPRTSTSNQKPGAGGRGRSVSLSLVLSSGLAQRRP